MNCEQFRAAVGAEPNSPDPGIAAHAAQCPACAQELRELQTMDRLIHQALTIDVPDQLRKHRGVSRRLSWSLAASVLLAVSIGLSIWLAGTRASFAEQVVAHVRHEPHALVSGGSLTEPPKLHSVLADHGLKLRANSARISYANDCWFRGGFVPHLVVQTESGPVTVLVLQNEDAYELPARIEESGFQGVVVSAPRGVLVVLGQDAEVSAVADTVLKALDYQNSNPG